jgi:hypothetical protein
VIVAVAVLRPRLSLAGDFSDTCAPQLRHELQKRQLYIGRLERELLRFRGRASVPATAPSAAAEHYDSESELSDFRPLGNGVPAPASGGAARAAPAHGSDDAGGRRGSDGRVGTLPSSSAAPGPPRLASGLLEVCAHVHVCVCALRHEGTEAYVSPPTYAVVRADVGAELEPSSRQSWWFPISGVA